MAFALTCKPLTSGETSTSTDCSSAPFGYLRWSCSNVQTLLYIYIIIQAAEDFIPWCLSQEFIICAKKVVYTGLNYIFSLCPFFLCHNKPQKVMLPSRYPMLAVLLKCIPYFHCFSMGLLFAHQFYSVRLVINRTVWTLFFYNIIKLKNRLIKSVSIHFSNFISVVCVFGCSDMSDLRPHGL